MPFKTGSLRWLTVLYVALSPNICAGGVTAKEFSESIESHRRALPVLAAATLKQFPTEFQDLSEELVTAYFAFHDKPKTAAINDLQSFGYSHALTLVQRLSEFHGLNKLDLSPSQLLKLEQTVSSLNDIEDTEKQNFFKSRQLSETQIENLKRIEHIVDVTDTGIFRRIEMGIKDNPHDGEKYLLREGDMDGASIAHWLEDNYAQIVPNRQLIDCGILLKELGLKR